MAARNRRRYLTEINTTPFVDVMLVLLVFVMVGAAIKKLRIDEKVARQEFDFDKLNKLNDSICDLEKELKSKHIDNMEKCWNILTEDQKKQAQELIKDFPRMKRNCQNDDNDMENQKQFRKRRFNN